MHRTAFATLALSLCLSLPASAAAQDANDTVITMKSGHVYQGAIVSLDSKTLMFRTGGGEELGLAVSELSPATLYQISLGRIAQSDGPGQMTLGDEALAAGLFARAKLHYHQAVEDDASLEGQFNAKMAALVDATGKALLDEAKQNLLGGDSAGAITHLSLLMIEVPQSSSAQEASQMLDTLHAQVAAQRQAAQQAQQTAAITQALAPAEQSYQASLKYTKEGLQAGSNQGAAINSFNSAVSRGNDGLAQLKSLTAQGSNTPGLADAITKLNSELVAQVINADIQLANVYNVRSSYNDAAGVVNKGLALDPKNEQLLALRSEIAANSASSGSTYGPWTGRRVGGPVPTPYDRGGAVPAPYKR